MMMNPEHVREATHRMQQAVWTREPIPAYVLGPRRLMAWLGIALALCLLRLSVRLLPKAQPVRLFVEGLTSSRPFRLRDLPDNLGVRPDDDDAPGPLPAPAR